MSKTREDNWRNHSYNSAIPGRVHNRKLVIQHHLPPTQKKYVFVYLKKFIVQDVVAMVQNSFPIRFREIHIGTCLNTQ
jgi:hypothetical protein